MKILAAALVVCSSLALAAEGDAPAPVAHKLAVLPFAALGGDVPQRAGTKAAGMLTTEFKNAEGVQLLDLHKPGGGTDPHADALAAARKSVEEAKDLRKRRKFRLADEALGKAIAAYKAHGAGVTEVAEVVDAFALQSAVQYLTGRDDEGLKSLTIALAIAPERELPLTQGSPLFTRLVTETRAAVKASTKGTLMMVESNPSGGAVTIDGLQLGGTPLQVKEVPAGMHLWKVALANGETVGGMVEVGAGKQARVMGASTTKDPESRILTSLAQNKLDPELLAAAKEHAAAVQADLVVFGALSKEGKGLALDTFLYVAAGGELRRLQRCSFDTELLSAGMEFFNLAGALSQKGGKAGDAVKVPAAVVTGPAPAGTRLAEAKYGVLPGKELNLDDPGAEPTKDEGMRKPAEQKSRIPLKKKP